MTDFNLKQYDWRRRRRRDSHWRSEGAIMRGSKMGVVTANIWAIAAKHGDDNGKNGGKTETMEVWR